MYNTNYNVAYPIANQPIANQPATTYTINYNTNYNVAYPVANQPEASRPVTAYSVNYNTNYNIAYPIDTQPETGRPVTTYTPGNIGDSQTILGVYFPGGAVSTVAPYIPATVIPYDSFPTGNLPVSVPPGGQIVIEFE